MGIVDQIIKPIQQEMVEFEHRFRENMHSEVAMLDKVTHYIIKRKGKQVRPMFVFLTAKMLGEVSNKTYDAATLVELLHTATLVHDDVVQGCFCFTGGPCSQLRYAKGIEYPHCC